MPRKLKAPVAPAKFLQVIAQLKQEPRPSLVAVKSLALSYAAKNDDFGARHFVKEALPRIRYYNPDLPIEVKKLQHDERVKTNPELVVTRVDGAEQRIPLAAKWSSTILAELLDHAGGPSWRSWKADRQAQGLPVLDDFGRVGTPLPPGLQKQKQPKLKGGKGAIQPQTPPPTLARGKRQTASPPSPGLPTQAAQEDIEKAKSGTHITTFLP